MPCERVVIALSRHAADQGIVHALVEAVNSSAVISLLVYFETGAQKKLSWKLFDREANGVRRVCKPPIPNWLSQPNWVSFI